MRRLLPLLLAFAASLNLAASSSADKVSDEVYKKISKVLPGIPQDDVRETPVDGIFEVRRGTDFGYVTGDGRYLIHGDMVDLSNGFEITEKRRNKARLETLSKLGDEKMITFAPPAPTQAKYEVTIFTDIDCGYCRKLHKEMKDYNAQGIAVHYLFYPRSGPGTESFKKAEAVWCSKDRQDAMTRAKSGESVTAAACSNPIMQHYKTGESLGIRGTPMIVLPGGEIVAGYLPASSLVARLSAPEPKADATAKN